MVRLYIFTVIWFVLFVFALSIHLFNHLIDVIIVLVEWVIGIRFIDEKFLPMDWDEILASYKGFIHEYV